MSLEDELTVGGPTVESMFIVDGGVNAELPSGSGGPVLAGPKAIFVAGQSLPMLRLS